MRKIVKYCNFDCRKFGLFIANFTQTDVTVIYLQNHFLHIRYTMCFELVVDTISEFVSGGKP